jgi:hypothetical protein
MSDKAFLDGWLFVLREACEGGRPGQGTAFLDGTKADGSGNNGLLATLDSLSAQQASDPTALGLSIAAHAAHTAYHLEVGVRWANGDKGPYDWPGSFEPKAVDDAAWYRLRARVRAAYAATLALAQSIQNWDEDAAGGLAATLAHVAYHLGALRQTVKLVAA